MVLGIGERRAVRERFLRRQPAMDRLVQDLVEHGADGAVSRVQLMAGADKQQRR